MTTLIVVYHSGMVITNKIGSYEFIGMNETFLLNEFPTLEKSCWFGVSAVELDE
jgi:hypothetical protein